MTSYEEKNTMKTIDMLNEEAESFFRQLNQDKEITKKAWQTIVNTIDNALKNENTNQLLSLIPYIENGDGRFAYQHIGETHRLLRIFHIIELENKYHKEPFLSDCSNYELLMEKYMLSLFALRRLLFQLSEESVNDAVSFLKANLLSPFAIYIILQDDLIIPDATLYQTIATIYDNIWSINDTQLFFSLIERTRS